MPPESPAAKPSKFYFYYGHRKPSQNRPTVRGGLFSNRQSQKHPVNRNSSNPLDFKAQKIDNPTSFILQNWDPEQKNSPKIPLRTSKSNTSSEDFFQICQKLTPIARYICDSFRKHKKWGPPVIDDLGKLRRITPNLVAEVLKVQNDPVLSSRFFHWAGKQKGYKHDFASYNAFTYCLNRSNQFRAADQVPELMHMQGKPPTEKQFEILIRMHADNNRGLRVFYVYEKMRKFGVKPRVFLYNRIMDALIKTGHLDLAMSVYHDLKEDGLMEESITFMILIKGLCKEGRMDEMFDLLGQMRVSLCKPDVFAYTAMIRVLVAEGNLDGCLKVWEEMGRDDVRVDATAYTTLITALCVGHRVEKAYELFKEMKEKGYLIDRVVYNALTEGFVVSGKVGSACDLLKDLIDSGYRPDLSIYNSLIKGLCDVNRVDKAYQLFQVTVKEGLQPDFETVNPILISYAESRKVDDFCSLLVQMEKLGLPIIDDLSRFFSCLVEKERLMVGLSIFADLKIKGYYTVPIYNILVGALYNYGQAKKALSLFSEMKDLNLEPDSSTYSLAIRCHVELEDIKEACFYYNKIREISCFPSVAAYHSLVKGLCKIGEIDAAILLVRDCLANVNNGPIEFKYTLTIVHICKLNDAVKVLDVLNEMIQQGCKPDDIAYCAVISGMCKHGTIEEARKVFLSMKDRELLTEANMIIYDEMLIDHMKKKTADLVVSGLKFFGLENKLKSKGCTLLSN
ncbi:hypothetical protein Nepgr_018902 [Nepenthes gracilis]|uniref:Pentatricopeptide repeat-containing protein n=1 Tax=Nepenthes gracilis TaxID=150966 RepID=A0AAD3SW05_NEPGR|nr:hypothetical protein Nepgr_018902 [Nepenthes gracilis]